MLKTAICGWPTHAHYRRSTSHKSILLAMKLTILMMITACSLVSAASRSQTVTYTGSRVPLTTVLKEVERQTGYSFFYQRGLLNGLQVASVKAEALSLDDFLKQILAPAFSFNIRSRTITITKAKADIIHLQFSDPVNGKITGDGGQPLPGATILVKGTASSVITGTDGTFTIPVKENDVLTIRFIGYQPRDIRITKEMITRGSLGNIALTIQSSELKNVEVIGTTYWSVTKEKSTASITKINAREIERQPVTSPLMALQGRVPGLEITPQNGVPGSAPVIRVRGQNSVNPLQGYPLYIVDGVPIDSKPLQSGSNSLASLGFDPLSNISISNIESIEVLKDADATAIYGSRGANGVIIITTKRSKPGKSSLTASVYTGMSRIANREKLMNTEQYLEMRREAFSNDGLTPGDLDFDVNGAWGQHKYTDWQKALLGNKGGFLDAQAQFSGGSMQTNYRLNVGYRKEEVVYPGDFGYHNTSVGFNLHHRSEDSRFNLSLSANYGANKNRLFNDLNFVGTALTLAPNAPDLRNSDGTINWEFVSLYGGTYSYPSFRANPLANLLRTHHTQAGNLIANAAISYEIIPGLTAKVNTGFTDLNGEEVILDPIAAQAPDIRPYVTGSSTFGTNKRQNWIVEPQLTYQFKTGYHQLNLFAGGTIQENIAVYKSLMAGGYTSDALLMNVNAAAYADYAANQNARYRYISFIARVGYDYMDKLLLNLTARRDGSSRFGPGRQFGNFGAVGAGYIFTKESFIENALPFLSFGKIRASYGITGSDQIGDYEFYERFGVTPQPYYGSPGIYPVALFNSTLAWEETKKLEFALQLGFLRDRIHLEASVYRNRSANQLLAYQLPATTGFTSISANLPATVQNKGFELMLGSENIRSGNIRWTSSFNISIPRNKLIAYPDIENSTYRNLYRVGKPLQTQRVYTFKEIDPTTGRAVIMDLNNDGTIDELDLTFNDQLAVTPFYGGLTNTFQVGRVTASFLLQFRKMSGQYNFYPGGNKETNQPVWMLERWQKPGDVTDIPKFTTVYDPNMDFVSQSDYGYTDASFIRLKTLEATYQFPESLFNARITLQAQNLFTLTRYRGFDPETGTSLPPLKMLSAGVQLKF